MRVGHHYLMWASSAAERQAAGGCELWVRRAPVDNPAEYHLLHADHRLLVVKGTLARKHVTIVVAHAPHAAKPATEVEQWWRAFEANVEKLCDKLAPRVCMIDANARVGSRTSFSVGSRSADKEDGAGGILHDFVLRAGMCLPSTFGPDPSGGRREDATWASRTGRMHRVVVPLCWQSAIARAWVDESVTLSTATAEDHRAASVAVTLASEPCARDRPRRPKRAGLRTPEGVAAVACAWAQAPPFTAAWSAERAQQAFTTFAQDVFRQACRPGAAAPRSPWVAPATWTVLKQHAHTRNFGQVAVARRILQRRALQAWRAALCEGPHHAKLMEELWQAQRQSHARLAYSQWFLAVEARAAARRCRADRIAWAEQKAHEVQAAADAGNTRPLWGLVRSLAGKRARRGPRPLTVVRMTDGSPASTPMQVAQLWLTKFAAEFGNNVEWRPMAVAPPPLAPIENEPLMPAERWEEEIAASIAAMPAGEAAGPDGIPAEYLKAAGEACNRTLASIAAKASVYGLPEAWRGGKMTPVPRKLKQPLSQSNCRGVLLADAAAKAYAKTSGRAHAARSSPRWGNRIPSPRNPGIPCSHSGERNVVSRFVHRLARGVLLGVA